MAAGRYHATPWGNHPNTGGVEWPPSPWRIARGLISAYYKAKPRPAESDMLPVLKKISYSLPTYCLPTAHPGHTRHYMPGVKQEVIDAFMCVRGPLFVLYPDVSLDNDESTALDSVLPAMQYLGRADAPCMVDAVDAADAPAPNCLPLNAATCPANGELVDVLAPRQGCDILAVSPDSLSARPADLHRTSRIDPPAGRRVQYTLPPGAPELRRSITRARRRTIDVVRFALVGSPLPHALQSLRVGQAARSAVLSMPSAKSGTLTGHGPGGGPARGHNHAMFLPTAETDPARIDHITVVARSGFDGADLEALFGLGRLFAYKVPEVRAVFESAGTLDDFSGMLGRSRVWRTVTPVVFTKHAKYRAGGRVVDSPETQIASEAKRRYGHDVMRVALLDRVGRYRPLEFSRPRVHGRRVDQTYGVRVEFSREVAGPLALGYGSHYGMGLFAPEAHGHG